MAHSKSARLCQSRGTQETGKVSKHSGDVALEYMVGGHGGIGWGGLEGLGDLFQP